MGHQHIFMSAAGCPDMQELLNAHTAKAQTCGYAGKGRDVATHSAELHGATPQHLRALQQQNCIFADVSFLSCLWDKGQ